MSWFIWAVSGLLFTALAVLLRFIRLATGEVILTEKTTYEEEPVALAVLEQRRVLEAISFSWKRIPDDEVIVTLRDERSQSVDFALGRSFWFGFYLVALEENSPLRFRNWALAAGSLKRLRTEQTLELGDRKFRLHVQRPGNYNKVFLKDTTFLNFLVPK